MYRIYVTDYFYTIGHLDKRYYDLLYQDKTPEDDRTAEEVISHISDELSKLERR